MPDWLMIKTKIRDQKGQTAVAGNQHWETPYIRHADTGPNRSHDKSPLGFKSILLLYSIHIFHINLRFFSTEAFFCLFLFSYDTYADQIRSSRDAERDTAGKHDLIPLFHKAVRLSRLDSAQTEDL